MATAFAPPAANPIPAHVPPELVVESPLFSRQTIYENPYDTIIPAIHAGPRMTYVTNIFPGKRPGLAGPPRRGPEGAAPGYRAFRKARDGAMGKGHRRGLAGHPD